MTYPQTAVDCSLMMNSEGPRNAQCWWYGVGVLAPAAHLSHHLTGFHVSAGRCWCRCTYFWFNEHYKWECQNKNLTIALAMSSKKLLYKKGRPVPKICRLVKELYRVIHCTDPQFIGSLGTTIASQATSSLECNLLSTVWKSINNSLSPYWSAR